MSSLDKITMKKQIKVSLCFESHNSSNYGVLFLFFFPTKNYHDDDFVFGATATKVMLEMTFPHLKLDFSIFLDNFSILILKDKQVNLGAFNHFFFLLL